jgi:hypothetical protein
MKETRLPPHERELLVYRIISGYIRYKFEDKVLLIRSPSDSIKYQAQEVFIEYYNKAKELGIPETYYDLIDWTNKEEDRLEAIKLDIEDSKIELYNNFYNDTTSVIIKSRLESLKQEQATLYNKKHSFSHLTCDGIASHAKRLFVLEKCTYLDGKRYNFVEISLNTIFNYCNEVNITEEMYREISRTEPWASYWRTKPRFKRLSDEQKYTILWSHQYDSVYKHPDCPPDDIIEDDDALDGWMLIKKKEREQKQNVAQIDKKLTNNKIKQSDEVYLVAASEKEIKQIDSLNTPDAKRIKKARFEAISAKGELKESELPDIIQENMIKMNEEVMRKIRNK